MDISRLVRTHITTADLTPPQDLVNGKSHWRVMRSAQRAVLVGRPGSQEAHRML